MFSKFSFIIFTIFCFHFKSFHFPLHSQTFSLIFCEINVYQTTANYSKKLEQLPTLNFTAIDDSTLPHIIVYPSQVHQVVDGFGASLTDSAAWVLSKNANYTTQKLILNELFDRNNGIALSFLRQPQGASDLSKTFFTYDDTCNQTIQPCTSFKSDVSLENFTINHDKEYITPLLRSITKINPDIMYMMTPWSPPGWMKTSGGMNGYDVETNGPSMLLKKYYQQFADYHVKSMQGYQTEGTNLYAFTVQNEPLWLPPQSMGMNMTAQEQVDFIANYLYPSLKKATLKQKIMVYDWGWGDTPQYPEEVLANMYAYNFSAGTSWHHYEGNATQMSVIHDKFPNKDNWMTEGSGFVGQTGNILAHISSELIQCMRNHAKAYVVWGLITDQIQGPHTFGGCGNCRGVITLNMEPNISSATFQKEPEYYALGQASKFLKKQAVRIGSTEPLSSGSSGLENVAFKNQDGSIVLYTLNGMTNDQEIIIEVDGLYARAKLPAGGVTTFVWK